jgi:DNA polymerase-4
MTPWVLHVDLDQFLVAVELLRRPDLRGRPVVVGGDGDPTRPRQVVSTASYEARAFGVHSGLPLRTALRRCPEAVFLPVDAPHYLDASEQVMTALRTMPGPVPVAVEVLGWDEAFLGADTDDPEGLARGVQRRVLDQTGLTCAVGVGDTTVRAKIATGFAKPGGVFTLTAATWLAVMGERPTDALWGVGRRTAAKLEALGVLTVADLAHADPDMLAATFGPTTGPWLRSLGRGIGRRQVVTEPWVPRSHSHETTFTHDLTDPDEVRAAVRTLASQVAADVIPGDGRPVTKVAVKVRTAAFFTATRIMTLRPPTRDPAALEAAALTVLDRFTLTRPVRLLGVRAELALPEEPHPPSVDAPPAAAG